jgi:4-hydroxy-3-methylbut-2-enyl diphosphate reductase
MLLITPTRAEYRAVEASLRSSPAAVSLERVMCGMGPECAAEFCRQLEARTCLPAALALIGVAGGLDPALAAGDVVLASVALDEDGRRAPCRVIPLPGAAIGPLITVSRALHTPAEKAAARDSGALAVEMEAYPLAAWAAARGLPFVHARVILDPFDEALPDLGNALDGYGRVRPLNLLRRMLTHPLQAAVVFRILRRSQDIAPALGQLARAAVTAYRI